jgi:hypothetical protein
LKFASRMESSTQNIGEWRWQSMKHEILDSSVQAEWWWKQCLGGSVLSICPESMASSSGSYILWIYSKFMISTDPYMLLKIIIILINFPKVIWTSTITCDFSHLFKWVGKKNEVSFGTFYPVLCNYCDNFKYQSFGKFNK